MALLPVDRAPEGAVFEGMLTASPKELPAIRDALASGGDRNKLSDPPLETSYRNPRASLVDGSARASRWPRWIPPKPGAPSRRWQQESNFLSKQLIAELAADTTSVDSWIELLMPSRTVLYEDLRAIFVDPKRPAIDRHMAATVLGEFVADQPGQLTDLMLEAEPAQYVVLLPKLRGLGDRAMRALIAAFNASIPATGTAEVRRGPVKRKAHAAVALWSLAAPSPWLPSCRRRQTPTWAPMPKIDSAGWPRPDILVELVATADTALRAAFVRSLAGMPYDRLPGRAPCAAG